jgi:hypothetical protein
MKYDPRGTGAAPDDFLVRRGKKRESRVRLAKQASLAEQAGFGHGVSLTSPEANSLLAKDPQDAVQALRRTFEAAGFEVRYTPTKADADHHTVMLSNPLTDAAADLFNTILGRV